MKLDLENFEQQIDETILDRGYRYFKKGKVAELTEVGPGRYEATVTGTEDYTVELRIKNGEITETRCDCPYDMGPVCKHIVAVIFAVQHDSDTLNLDATTTTTRKATRQKPTPKSPSEKAGSELRAMIRREAGRDRYIDYRGANRIGRYGYTMVDEAMREVEKGDILHGVYSAFAVLDGLVPTLNYCDDSSGEIGGAIEGAFDLLIAIVERPLDENVRKYLYDTAVTTHANGTYSGWDWHMSMIELAIKAAKSTAETSQLKKLIAEIEQKEKGSEYTLQKTQLFMVGILKKSDGVDAANKYMLQNIANPDIRKILIEREIAQGNYHQAKQFANDGIKCDNKRYPGLVSQWRNYLLLIAKKSGDTPSIIELATHFLLYEHLRSPFEEYYNALKDNTSTALWPARFESLMSQLERGDMWSTGVTAYNIYILEQMWGRLLAFVQRRASLRLISDAEKYLKKLYPSELATLYIDGTIAFLAEYNSVSRPKYKEACRYLRRAIKLGERAKTEKAVEQLRALYPQRRALMEELDNL